jgi:nitrogen regulation protein NR(I)
MLKLLIVDDEPNVLYSLQRTLQTDSLQLLTASTGQRAVDLLEEERPDVVLLDVRLPDMSGLETFDLLRQIDPRLPVIFMTAYSSAETAIQAMQRGAFEYLLKPVEVAQLRQVVQRALETSRLRQVPAVVDQAEFLGENVDLIVGQSPSMQEVYKAIGRVAPQDVTVLIQGESGTGKELVARSIFHYSRRAHRPFLAVNCAAIPESLLESELFGHERGAFTGADRRRIGKFEQTHEGTLFLDEIGDMTGATQAKMLRILQDQCFERLGGNELIQTDVRIVAATNQNLLQLVDEGKFRQDLYYRLNIVTIFLPPLRERVDDLPRLADYFRQRFNPQLGKNVVAFSADALAQMQAYHWPGNVRELQSAIKHALLHATGDVIGLHELPSLIRSPHGTAPPPEMKHHADAALIRHIQHLLQTGQTDLHEKLHREVDRILITQALEHLGGNQVQTAELLGIARMTLRNRIRELGISSKRGNPPEGSGS